MIERGPDRKRHETLTHMSRIRGPGGKKNTETLSTVPKYRDEDEGLRLRSETREVVHLQPQEKLNLWSYCVECTKSSLVNLALPTNNSSMKKYEDKVTA